MLGVPVIGPCRGKIASRQQVVLVGGEDHAVPQGLAVELLPFADGVEDALCFLDGVWAHLGLVGVAAHPERDRAHAGERRVAVQDAGQRVLERSAVVDPRAHDDLAVHLDAPVEKDLEPAQARRPLRVAEHVRPQLRVRRVDGHEQRSEPLGQDALGVELGEAGQRGEVAVEEGQPVVVVLEVQAAPHALGQLVDEAERAVVVAGADPVEDGRGNLHAERLADDLVDPDHPWQRRAGAANEDAEVARVAEALEIDDVTRFVPINAEELVAHGQTGPGCRRRRGDRSHRGS